MSLEALAYALFLTEAAVCVGADAVVGLRRPAGAPWHRWADSLESIAVQAFTGCVAFFGKLWLILVYGWVLESASLGLWAGRPVDYVWAFLAYDLLGYVFHRASHETALGWAVHQVHHQPEEYNITVAMRTAPFRSALDWPTILPLAVLGVPMAWTAVLFVIHIAGQYWLHVRWIGRLDALGWVVNTPSHHRVHHGCQPGYQDANYGANLIVWDRLFGTFVPEREAPVYGIAASLPGHSPLRSVFGPFARAWQRTEGWSPAHRLLAWVRHPGWNPKTQVSSETTRNTGGHGSDPGFGVAPRKVEEPCRTLPQALLEVALANGFLLSAPAWPALGLPAALLLVHGLVALHRVGQHLENRPPSMGSERVRAALMAASAVLFPPWIAAALLGVGLALGLGTLVPRAPEPAR
ncbi:MAG: sterol desaturase family protein [Myxococcota bacterium]